MVQGGEGSASRPGRSLSPRKTQYPLYRSLIGPQGQSGYVRKILPQPGFDYRTVQPVASHYTDYATRPIILYIHYIVLCEYLIWCLFCIAVVLNSFVMCSCFGNMCTCIYCVFVLFRLCIFILICFVCTGVRTTATEGKFNCS
jgi:hypothetical protein